MKGIRIATTATTTKRKDDRTRATTERKPKGYTFKGKTEIAHTSPRSETLTNTQHGEEGKTNKKKRQSRERQRVDARFAEERGKEIETQQMAKEVGARPRRGVTARHQHRQMQAGTSQTVEERKGWPARK